MADDVYGENLLKMRATYNILKLVKAGEKPMTRGGSM
jgi:hypothetical protein